MNLKMKKIIVILMAIIAFGFNVNAQSSDLIGTKWKGKGQLRYWTIEFHKNSVFRIIDNSPYKQQPVVTTYSYNNLSST
jgi:hypothetical protein